MDITDMRREVAAFLLEFQSLSTLLDLSSVRYRLGLMEDTPHVVESFNQELDMLRSVNTIESPLKMYSIVHTLPSIRSHFKDGLDLLKATRMFSFDAVALSWLKGYDSNELLGLTYNDLEQLVNFIEKHEAWSGIESKMVKDLLVKFSKTVPPDGDLNHNERYISMILHEYVRCHAQFYKSQCEFGEMFSNRLYRSVEQMRDEHCFLINQLSVLSKGKLHRLFDLEINITGDFDKCYPKTRDFLNPKDPHDGVDYRRCKFYHCERKQLIRFALRAIPETLPKLQSMLNDLEGKGVSSAAAENIAELVTMLTELLSAKKDDVYELYLDKGYVIDNALARLDHELLGATKHES